MPKIQLLPDILASQVAAGEVVERPASVVKELVENALDAGATEIQVEIQKGGAALIRIKDNGCGMSREDALLSLERHATSKLRRSEDLQSVSTMGFRGEALPSIASVSQFRLLTQETNAVEGTEIIASGGVIKEVKQAGLSAGTSIEIKQLFFNIPARKKFLKADSTESAHVEHQVRLHALSAPEVRFRFKKENRIVFDLPATSDRRVRILGLMGQSIAHSLIEISAHERMGMEVEGFLLPAEFARRSKRQQSIFLNGRPIEDVAISQALREGFRESLAEGMQPTAWLWLTMHPGRVDVNVHPAKREVRFQRPHDVRFLITEAVVFALTSEKHRLEKNKATIISRMDGSAVTVHGKQIVATPLAENTAIEKKEHSEKKETLAIKNPELESAQGVNTENDSKNQNLNTKTNNQTENPSLKSETSQAAEKPKLPESNWQPPQVPEEELITEEKIAEKKETKESQEKKVPFFEILSVLNKRYIILQNPEGIVLFYPKAARERITYEKLMTGKREIKTQSLLVPEILELEPRDFELVSRNLEHFEEAGIQIEVFGNQTFQISEIPHFLPLANVRQFMNHLIDGIIESQETKKGKLASYAVFAKQVAKKTGMQQVCKLEHTKSLLSELFQCDLPYCDTSGNPTLVQISVAEIERKFKGLAEKI